MASKPWLNYKSDENAPFDTPAPRLHRRISTAYWAFFPFGTVAGHRFFRGENKKAIRWIGLSLLFFILQAIYQTLHGLGYHVWAYGLACLVLPGAGWVLFRAFKSIPERIKHVNRRNDAGGFWEA